MQSELQGFLTERGEDEDNVLEQDRARLDASPNSPKLGTDKKDSQIDPDPELSQILSQDS